VAIADSWSMRLKNPTVYILASRKNGTLYIGVTSDLRGRLWKHRMGITGGFVAKYAVYSLVYFEFHDSMLQAIRREKQLKEWKRLWKIRLIEEKNPDWKDMRENILS
jgi:putative endonuclease